MKIPLEICNLIKYYIDLFNTCDNYNKVLKTYNLMINDTKQNLEEYKKNLERLNCCRYSNILSDHSYERIDEILIGVFYLSDKKYIKIGKRGSMPLRKYTYSCIPVMGENNTYKTPCNLIMLFYPMITLEKYGHLNYTNN